MRPSTVHFAAPNDDDDGLSAERASEASVDAEDERQAGGRTDRSAPLTNFPHRASVDDHGGETGAERKR